MEQVATAHIRTRIEGAVGYITIDRPERFNSLDVRTAQDLRRAGLALARDDRVREYLDTMHTNAIFCTP